MPANVYCATYFLRITVCRLQSIEGMVHPNDKIKTCFLVTLCARDSSAFIHPSFLRYPRLTFLLFLFLSRQYHGGECNCVCGAHSIEKNDPFLTTVSEWRQKS